jgi:superfamily II DNA or RNA helicase
MSYRIRRNELTSKQIKKISSDLILTPKVNDYFKWGNKKKEDEDGNKDDSGGDGDIIFYLTETERSEECDDETESSDEIIVLPFMYAAQLLNIIPNKGKDFIEISEVEFSGELRNYQIPVYNEVKEQIKKFGTSTLGVYPGFGKTVLGAKIACDCGLLTCVMYPRETLGIQWKNTFEKNTNLKCWIVGDRKGPPEVYHVILCLDGRWNKIPNEIRLGVGTLIIDEAHMMCTPSRVRSLLAFSPYYILIETATLERDDGMHAMIHNIAGDHGVFREVNKTFKVIKVITGTVPERRKMRNGQLDYVHLKKTTLINPRRDKIILDIVKNNEDKTILILTSLVDHVNNLMELFEANELECDFMAGKKLSYYDSPILIGTTSKIGTGFDQENFCLDYSGKKIDLLILVTSIKKRDNLVQYVGRALRSDYPTVFHFVDHDNIYENHWKIARPWYKKSGAELSEYKAPDAEEEIQRRTAQLAREGKLPQKTEKYKQSQPDLKWIQERIKEIKNEE